MVQSWTTLECDTFLHEPCNRSTQNQVSQYDMSPGNSCPSNSVIKILCQKYILRRNGLLLSKFEKMVSWTANSLFLFLFFIQNQSLFLMEIGGKLIAAALKIACSWKHAQTIIRLITFSGCSVSEVFSVEESNAYTRFSANWTHYTCININFWMHSKKMSIPGKLT